MKYLLGLSYGHHESSACLLAEDGSWTYAREEWYSRIKHDHRYPRRAIQELIQARSDPQAQIVAACLHEKPLRTWLGTGFKKGLSFEHYMNKVRQLKHTNLSIHSRLKADLKLSPKQVFFSSHHLCHHLTGLMLTSQPTQQGLVLDGYGEGVSGAIIKGVGADLEVSDFVQVQASLGLMYSALTEWCGYAPASDEFKVMALSAYAEPVHLPWILDHVLVRDQVGFQLNTEYFNLSDTALPTFTQKFTEVFGPSVQRSVFADMTSAEAVRVCQVVASFQAALEHAVLSYISMSHDEGATVDAALMLSGGVFANTKMVAQVMRTRAKPTYVSASPGDAGSSIGAAYYAAQLMGWLMSVQTSAFVGNELRSLANYPHLFRPVVDQESTHEWIEKFLQEGGVLPFFQGVAEIGPRSLGVRSLICRIDQPGWISVLNQVVKQREKFRPIAPMMLGSDPAVSALNLNDSERTACRHMGTLVHATPEFIQQLPHAANLVHVDQTLRLQLLEEQDIQSSRMHKSIPKLLAKHRILANTSFNISGDPTVGTPLDCYINMRRMNLQFVAADNMVYQVV